MLRYLYSAEITSWRRGEVARLGRRPLRPDQGQGAERALREGNAREGLRQRRGAAGRVSAGARGGGDPGQR